MLTLFDSASDGLCARSRLICKSLFQEKVSYNFVSYVVVCCVYIYKELYRSSSKKAARRTEKKEYKTGHLVAKKILGIHRKSSVNSHFAVATVNIYTLVAMQGRFAAGIARDNKALVHTNIDWFRASPV